MKRKSVLIIEDNELNLEMLSLIIDKDFNVVKAHNGLEALNYLKTSFNDISLILTDIYMPIMNGYEFLDNLKKDPQLSLIPVIVMTQANSDEEELLALKHGANDFFTKTLQASNYSSSYFKYDKFKRDLLTYQHH